MNFDFETSRVDCISNKNITLISVYEKITSQSLETPSLSPTIFSKKNIQGNIYTYAFGLCKQKYSFFRRFKLIISIPIYPLQRIFYPQNLACTPKNDEVPYMLLYIVGTKISNKTKCTPNFKMQWEP